MQHHDQSPSWGGKGLFGLYFHIAVYRQRKSSSQRKQEPGGKSCYRGSGGVLPRRALLWRTQDLQPRGTLPTVGWALPQQSLRKCLPAGSYVGVFSAEFSSFQITQVCVSNWHKTSERIYGDSATETRKISKTGALDSSLSMKSHSLSIN